jgi:hypothetical protein
MIEEALPREELSILGLYSGGKFLLEDEDIDALLSGHRTNLIRMKNLKGESFQIDSIDAKLSLDKNIDGRLTIKLNPIYKEVHFDQQLEQSEVEELLADAKGKLEKIVPSAGDKSKKLIFEYDQETREIISYDPSMVQAPLKINGEELSDKQKEDFALGEVLELKDGTKVQHRASERNGLLSDRSALVLSVLLDGGISYLLVRGIRSLLRNDEIQQTSSTPAFENALREMQKANLSDPKLQQDEPREPTIEDARELW